MDDKILVGARARRGNAAKLAGKYLRGAINMKHSSVLQGKDILLGGKCMELHVVIGEGE